MADNIGMAALAEQTRLALSAALASQVPDLNKINSAYVGNDPRKTEKPPVIAAVALDGYGWANQNMRLLSVKFIITVLITTLDKPSEALRVQELTNVHRAFSDAFDDNPKALIDETGLQVDDVKVGAAPKPDLRKRRDQTSRDNPFIDERSIKFPVEVRVYYGL